ncbi:hypothetical protein COBT_001307 [Conglomerata obtusa]
MTKDEFKKLLMTIFVCLFLVTCIIYCSISKESKNILKSQEITENDILSKNKSIIGASTFLKIVSSNLSTHILMDRCDQIRPRSTIDRLKLLESSNKNAFLSHKKILNTYSNENIENLSTINYNIDNINNIVCNEDILNISNNKVISKPCSILNVACEKNLNKKDIVSYKIKRKLKQIDNNNTRNEKSFFENLNKCCIVKDINKGRGSRSIFTDEKTTLYNELILLDTNHSNTDNEVNNDEKLHEHDQTQQIKLHNRNIISNYTQSCSNNSYLKLIKMFKSCA